MKTAASYGWCSMISRSPSRVIDMSVELNDARTVYVTADGVPYGGDHAMSEPFRSMRPCGTREERRR